MRPALIRSPLRALLSGVMLAACGGAPGSEQVASEEPVGTRELAQCAGTSVSTLTILGVSSYGNEVAGSGSWAVSYPANAIHLDYYIDGVKMSSEERCNASGGLSSCTGSGDWNFSYDHTALSCGSHTFEVRAYPMVIDSAGNRIQCQTSGPRSASRSFTQSCPGASLSCSRSGDYVVCEGSGSGGTGSPYTPFWQLEASSTQSDYYLSTWSSGDWSRSYYCPPTYVYIPSETLNISFKVRDSAGAESYSVGSYGFTCQAGTYFYYDPGFGW
ncbi:MAG TPA: hypothetical protein VFZ09_42625 [Archangium sp.]|uniref:hypothetical protein n=1 Tax=Archangium sp. TaxID=1872627 RepID=UPI002E2F5BB1|nr:hypothetical protein [Archangium sp.]HEX5752976.1 hypothetical protein [Archangium sp.]